MFFCQVEAIETLIYLLELGIPGRLSSSGYKTFEVDAALLSTLLASLSTDVLKTRLRAGILVAPRVNPTWSRTSR